MCGAKWRRKVDWLLNESDWQSLKISKQEGRAGWEVEGKLNENDQKRKIFRDDFNRNSPSVFNSKVMIGIMRAIVVDAIEAEWMDLLRHKTHYKRWSWKGRWKLIQLCELCSNELRWLVKWRVGGVGRKVDEKPALMTSLIRFLIFATFLLRFSVEMARSDRNWQR